MILFVASLPGTAWLRLCLTYGTLAESKYRGFHLAAFALSGLYRVHDW